MHCKKIKKEWNSRFKRKSACLLGKSIQSIQMQVQARIHAAVVLLYSSQLNAINYEKLFTT